MKLPAHLRALRALRRAKVDCVMIGAMALGHYSAEASTMYQTGDCDILVRPTLDILKRALAALKKTGYDLSAGDEPLSRPDDMVLRRILERRIVVRAQAKDGMPIDLLTEAIGFPFEVWWKSRRYFSTEGVQVACAGLEEILQSKRKADRPKDRALLAMLDALARDVSPKPRARRKR